MSHWEHAQGESDDWLTPRYIFDALREFFDLDVAHPRRKTNVPCRQFLSENSLAEPWEGFVWMNPPFGGRNGIAPWLDKFFDHGNGIALCPDRTSAPWAQSALRRCSSVLFISPKVKFIRLDGTVGAHPSTGTLLLAAGDRANTALLTGQARGLGVVKV